jgi:exodeoxyribonuclease-5
MERLKRLELRLCDIHQPRFVLNEQSLVREADLIVLDEVSMVGPEMAADLLAFGKPILVLGDPGQLPPIKGAGAFTDMAPDVMLTEIHRQAGESAIIRLATMARQGEQPSVRHVTPPINGPAEEPSFREEARQA